MSDKLNCFECKNWFDVNELIYLPTEQYYLCHHDAATHYAIKCETLRAERDELRAVVEAARKLQVKMLRVYNTPEYQTVWSIAQSHVGKYEGGNWIDEFDELAAELARVDGEK